jgi:FKBP-type peptidyl-prolyl cis-trans isomerase
LSNTFGRGRIPQDLAYRGQAGSPAGMLVFDVDLIRIE